MESVIFVSNKNDRVLFCKSFRKKAQNHGRNCNLMIDCLLKLFIHSKNYETVHAIERTGIFHRLSMLLSTSSSSSSTKSIKYLHHNIIELEKTRKCNALFTPLWFFYVCIEPDYGLYNWDWCACVEM